MGNAANRNQRPGQEASKLGENKRRAAAAKRQAQVYVEHVPPPETQKMQLVQTDRAKAKRMLNIHLRHEGGKADSWDHTESIVKGGILNGEFVFCDPLINRTTPWGGHVKHQAYGAIRFGRRVQRGAMETWEEGRGKGAAVWPRRTYRVTVAETAAGLSRAERRLQGRVGPASPRRPMSNPCRNPCKAKSRRCASG